MTEIKPCPFCGSSNFLLDGTGNATHETSNCVMSCFLYPISTWNSRPPGTEETKKENDFEQLEKSVQFLRKNGLEIR